MIERLKIGLFNATGLRRSLDNVINTCIQQNIDILIITETFLLRGRYYTDWLQYHTYAKQHENNYKGFGGISVLVRPDLNIHIHQYPYHNDETLSFKIGAYTIHALYLPPSTLSDEQATSRLDRLHIDDYTIIVGDLNARSHQFGDHRTNERAKIAVEPWLLGHGLHVWNSSLTRGQPTFRNHQGTSIIDLFISKMHAIEDPQMEIFDQMSLHSDHHLCTLSFNPRSNITHLPPPNAARQHWKLQRLTDREVNDLYRSKFQQLATPIEDKITLLLDNNSRVMEKATIEQIGKNLETAIHTALDESVTRTKLRPKNWKSFWNDELQEKVDQREEAYRKWRNAPDNLIAKAECWKDYSGKREALSLAIRRARNRQWRLFCNKLASSDISEMNSAIKRMRRNRQTSHTFSHPDGPQQAAEDMVSHLASVFGGEGEYSPWSICFEPENEPDDPIEAVEIEEIIRKLAPRKAPGDDHITGGMIKPIAAPLSILLSKFFRLCWRWSWIPISWRTAQVVPIFKKGDSTVAGNYRPISLTSIFRKLLERILLPRLLESMPMLDIAQGGFRHKRGALDQAFVLNMLIRRYKQIYNSDPAIITMDIKSAYDSVDRDTIWSTLQGNLPSALFHLVRHMFNEVRLAVILKNFQSRYIHPRRGVLQGSILSPMLYAIFIDTLPKKLRQANPLISRPLILRTPPLTNLTEADADHLLYTPPSHTHQDRNRPDTEFTIISSLLYADDVALIADPDDMVRLLKAAEQHSRDLGYRWHPSKCTATGPLPTPSEYDHIETRIAELENRAPPPPSYKLYNIPIPTTPTFKYLGLPFNQEGLDKLQVIKQSSAKAAGNMALLRSMGIHQYGIGIWAAIRAYRTFVRPVLEYGIAITAANQNEITRLENAQNGCIKRVMNYDAERQLPTIAIQTLADIPSMRLRLRILQLKFVARLHELPTSTLLRCVELSFLRRSRTDKQWTALTSYNPVHKVYKKIKKNERNTSTTDPVKKAIKIKRDDEFSHRHEKFPSIAVLRNKRMVDPVLYLPASRLDRHRLVKWRMRWLPPFPSPNCRCGAQEIRREHYNTCYLISFEKEKLIATFGEIPELPLKMHFVDYILNSLPRHEVGLTMGKWKDAWPALIRYLREVDYLCHPDGDFDDIEPAPEEALSIPPPMANQPPTQQ